MIVNFNVLTLNKLVYNLNLNILINLYFKLMKQGYGDTELMKLVK